MRRRLPSTTMLLAFEAAARALSFTQAGKELSLSQSAISQQIQGLEDFLGIALFVRARQRLQFTDAGRLFQSRITPALNNLEGAILETITSQRSGSSLNIGVPPTFAAKWLIPRLPRFATQWPGVAVNLVSSVGGPDLTTNRWDAAVYFGSPLQEDRVLCDRLMGEELVVVCSPSVRPQLRRPEDLADAALLHLSSREHAWTDWLSRAGVGSIPSTRGAKFELFSMVSQAAAAGLGVAVLPRFLVLDELASRQLVIPFGPCVGSAEQGYFLARPAAKSEWAPLLHFRQWLMEEAANNPVPA
ncbi:LysR family transcriptional regulator [Ramlibacter sp. WS9]|nr:LysR family transcriptional regulator [Ramlibacter sp. WS9]